jgi:hypothetical protein
MRLQVTDDLLAAPLNQDAVLAKWGVTKEDAALWIKARRAGEKRWAQLHEFHRNNPTSYPVPKGYDEHARAEAEAALARGRDVHGRFVEGNSGSKYGQTGRVKAEAIARLNNSLAAAVDAQNIIMGALSKYVQRVFEDDNYTFSKTEAEHAGGELRHVDLADIKIIHNLNEKHFDRINGKPRQRIIATLTTDDKQDAEAIKRVLDNLDDDTKEKLAQMADPLEIDE